MQGIFSREIILLLNLPGLMVIYQKTAEFIGMERTALHRKLKYLGIDKKNLNRYKR